MPKEIINPIELQCLGFCRISDSKQDLVVQRERILRHTNRHQMSVYDFVEVQSSADKRKHTEALKKLYALLDESGVKCVVTAELSRLGRSVGHISQVVDVILHEKKCRLICIQENLDLHPGKELDLQSEMTLMLFSMLARIERRLISERTRAGMLAAKAKGVQLGRPTGKSKLDADAERIYELRHLGVPKSKIIKHVKCDIRTLNAWLKRHRKDFERWLLTQEGSNNAD